MIIKIRRLIFRLLFLTTLPIFGHQALAVETTDAEDFESDKQEELEDQVELHKKYRQRAPKVRNQSNEVEQSAAARRNNDAGIAGRLGVYGNKLYSSGVEGYKIVDGQAQYGGTLISGSSDVKYSIDDALFSRLQTAEFKSTLIGFQGRWFFGNSFAVGGFGGFEFSSLTYQIGGSASSGMINGKIEGRSLRVGGFLGNHWTWDNGFTLGCDWFGIMLPTGSAFSESSATQGTPMASDFVIESNVKDYLKDIHTNPGIIAVMFGIGGSF